MSEVTFKATRETGDCEPSIKNSTNQYLKSRWHILQDHRGDLRRELMSTDAEILEIEQELARRSETSQL